MAISFLSGRTEALIELLFAQEDREEATRLLAEECGNNLPLLETFSPVNLERFRFAALKLSGGDLPKFREAVRLAQADWRDLLVSAEFAHDLYSYDRWAREKLKGIVPAVA